MALPQEVEWNIIKFMSHPCADIIKEALEEAEEETDIEDMNTEDPNTWTEDYLKERDDDMINECYPLVEIGVLRKSPAEVLEVMDPIAYNIGMQEYWETQKEDYEWDF